MSDKCIINVATGRYVKGQDRLRESLQSVGFDGEFFGYTAEHQIGAPIHKDNPYAFKIYTFDEALRQGYKQILWLDASVWAVKPLDSIWEHIQKEGYIMQEAGHNCGRWSNDRCLEYFEVNRDDAMEMLCYGNAGFLGLNFDNPKAREFFTRWKESMLAGMFKGAWNNDNRTESQDDRCSGHRHDLVCGSLIANQLDMTYQKGDEILAYASETDEVNDTIVLKAQGLV